MADHVVAIHKLFGYVTLAIPPIGNSHFVFLWLVFLMPDNKIQESIRTFATDINSTDGDTQQFLPVGARADE